MLMSSCYVQNQIAYKPLFIWFAEESKKHTPIWCNEKICIDFYAYILFFGFIGSVFFKLEAVRRCRLFRR